MISAALIGSIAGTLTTASFLPQVWKSFRSRSCGDISYSMLLVMALGTALWTLYGVMLGRVPIMVPNGITFVQLCSLIVMKASYHSPTKEG